jgi:hypothetical protein
MPIIHAINENRRNGIAVILRAYGIFQVECEDDEDIHIFEGENDDFLPQVMEFCGKGFSVIWISPPLGALSSLSVKSRILTGKKRLYSVNGGFNFKAACKFGLKRLGVSLEFKCLNGIGILKNSSGLNEGISLGVGKGRLILIGPNIVDEIVMLRQGNPDNTNKDNPYDLQKCTCERPQYLYEGIIEKANRFIPEADIWGWFFAILVLSVRKRFRFLVWPLPNQMNFIPLFTSDGDEASVEQCKKYNELVSQLGFSNSVFLTPRTGGQDTSPEKLFPEADFGLHPTIYESSALSYKSSLDKQYEWFVKTIGKSPRVVRNHMYFNNGYSGCQKLWASKSIYLNLNIPEMFKFDSGKLPCVLNGSFLPLRFRDDEGTWLNHWTLSSPYGDGIPLSYGMLGGWMQTVSTAFNILRMLRKYCPGIFVLSFHPHNIERIRLQLRFSALLLRKNILSQFRVGELVDFLRARERLSFKFLSGKLIAVAPVPIRGLTIVDFSEGQDMFTKNISVVGKSCLQGYFNAPCRILSMTRDIQGEEQF